MIINNKEKPLIYTNIFLFVPLIISIKNNYASMSILLGLVFVFSVLHHTFKRPGSEWWWKTKGRNFTQTSLLTIEVLLSIVLAISSTALLLKKFEIHVVLLVLVVFIPSFILYLNTDYKKYVSYHSIWHFVVAGIISLSLV